MQRAQGTNDRRWFSVGHSPGTAFSSRFGLFGLILPVAPWYGFYCYPKFTEKKVKVMEVETAQQAIEQVGGHELPLQCPLH